MPLAIRPDQMRYSTQFFDVIARLKPRITLQQASDDMQRRIDVLPDGKKIEVSLSDRLAGKVTKVIDIPANAVPDASKLIVKVYPGVFSQILEGVDGLIRLPGG